MAICVTTTVIYARAWELMLPSAKQPVGNPIPGKTTPEIVIRLNRLLVLLPDGRLWKWNGIWSGAPQMEPQPVEGSSRWIALASTPGTDLAIKQDGTLWAWGGWPLEGGKSSVYRPTAVQVGTDSDWKTVACGHNHAIALKRDGSLWAWGANRYGQLGDGTETNRTPPVRIGSDTDWAKVAAGGDYAVALKKDGSLWHWGLFPGLLGYRVERADRIRHAPTRLGAGTNWSSVFCCEHFPMAIQRDGGLWAWGQVPVPGGTYVLAKEPMRVAGQSRWKTVDPLFGCTAGIRAEGSLWRWGISYTWPGWIFGSSRTGQPDDMIRISERSDWIATAAADYAIIALSADGRLWSWGRPLNDPATRPRWSCYSRRPELVADLSRGGTD